MDRNNLEQYNTEAPNWWSGQGPFTLLDLLNGPRFQYFDTTVPSWENLNVLDVGCGGGFTSEFLAKRKAKVWGLDRAERLVDVARQHAASEGLKIDYRVGDALALPYDDGFFDVVVCVDVLEHVPDVQKCVGEIFRVLKPGGLFAFDTINRTLSSKWIVVWLLENVLKKVPKGTHDWNMFIKPKELEEFLLNVGFGKPEYMGLQIFGENLKKRALRYRLCNDTSTLYLGKAFKPLA